MKEIELYKILTHSTEETESAGALFAAMMKSCGFVAMYGDLGAGKTAFVRGFASVLAPEAEVSSPSYTVINEYESERIKVCHCDVYRIESEDDLCSVGFFDYEDCVMIVEWCEKIPSVLPDEYYKVKIDKVDENSRMICITHITK